jgi:electron transport complex protein RnfG
MTSGTDAYKKVLPDANFFIMVGSTNLGSKEGVSATVKGESQKGVLAGYAITANGRGYSSTPIQLVVGIGLDGKIKGIEILSMRETPGIGDRVNNGSFLNKYVGMANNDFMNKTMPDRADIITGATFSSRGVFSAVKAALGQYATLAGGAK